MTRHLQATASLGAPSRKLVLGFISGANFVWYLADHRNPNVGNDVDPDALFAVIERYCQQHQRDGLHAAVEGVYSQLAAR